MLVEKDIREQICEIGRRLYEKGFVAANDGNISVRISEKEIITTPTGVSKGFMDPSMLCKVDLNGVALEETSEYRPSSELKMHLRVYEKRPEIKAVVHAHPPYATSFAIARKPLNKPIIAEAIVTLGYVPIADYATPSSSEVPDAVEKYLMDCDAMLLANHGALAYAEDLMSAYFKMESLEFYARVTYLTSQLGGATELEIGQIEELYRLRDKIKNTYK